MLKLVLRNLARRPLRHGLTVGGLAVAIAVLLCVGSFGEGYERALRREWDQMGVQMMLVPLGCPYAAAAHVLKDQALESSLPAQALKQVRADPAVAVAAPMLLAALPRPREGRTDLWVGLDESALQLKPWWRMKSGDGWFTNSESVILGSEAAAVEMRQPGDKFYSPEARQPLRVGGVLERSGTSDDSVFFLPLATAQQMFGQPGRLTAIAIRLHDPAALRETSERLQRIPGAQVVTMTEMMGTFLNMIGAARTLVQAIAAIAVIVSALTVFNTLLAGVIERTNELTLMRALGASRGQVLGLLTAESLLLTVTGSILGLALALIGGPIIESVVKQFVPLAPKDALSAMSAGLVLRCVLTAAVVGLLAAIYPAWRANRLQPADVTRIA